MAPSCDESFSAHPQTFPLILPPTSITTKLVQFPENVKINLLGLQRGAASQSRGHGNHHQILIPLTTQLILQCPMKVWSRDAGLRPVPTHTERLSLTNKEQVKQRHF